MDEQSITMAFTKLIQIIGELQQAIQLQQQTIDALLNRVEGVEAIQRASDPDLPKPYIHLN